MKWHDLRTPGKTPDYRKEAATLLKLSLFWVAVMAIFLIAGVK